MKNLIFLLAIILSASFFASCSSDGSSNTAIGDSPGDSPGINLPPVDSVDLLDIDGDGIPNATDPDDDNDNALDGVDVDDDGDGLIEIADTAALNNIRYNLAGTSYDDEENDDAGNEGDSSGCGGLNSIAVCSGYELVADITLPTATGTPAKNWQPVGDTTNQFSATLDGNGFTINNLVINIDGRGAGFVVALSGTIRNLNFRGGSVTNNYAQINVFPALPFMSSTGAVAATMRGGVLDAVSADLPITATRSSQSRLGGLVGGDALATGSIINSYATGDVTGGKNNFRISAIYSGGLIGHSNAIFIKNSYATGTVAGGDKAGGLVGGSFEPGVSIENSYATGNVVGGGAKVDLGGLSGAYAGAIRNSYATGNVSDGSTLGGLVGRGFGSGAFIENSYATGNVIGFGFLGGLSGLYSGAIKNSYATGPVTGVASVDFLGGLVGKLGYGGSIADSYTISIVQSGRGIDYVGALVGVQASDATISNSYYNNEETIDISNPIPPDTLLSVGNSKTADELKGLDSNDSLSSNDWVFEAGKYPTLRSYKLDALVQVEGDILCGQAPDTDFEACVVTTPDRTIGDTDGDGTNDDIDTDDDGDSVLDGDDVDDDGDGLIEIATFAELNNIRYNLAGTSYDDEEADTGTGNDVGNSSGCGGLNSITVCSGYELVADITMPTATGTPAKNWVPVGEHKNEFSATLEGNDYTINGLIINSNARHVGFIGGLTGRIANLNFRGGSVVSGGRAYVGAVVGTSNEGELDRVSTGLPVTSSNGINVGGLVGSAFVTLIKNSNSTGEIITGGSLGNVGGLVGNAYMITIENSYATGNVTNNVGSFSGLGGLVGTMTNRKSIIRNSYAKGNITGSDSRETLGGLVGKFSGTIKNSYATGDVAGGNGDDTLGGLVGAQRGSIENSYAIGRVTTGTEYDRIGYLVGYQSSGIVFRNNYYQSGQTFDLDNTGSYHANDTLLVVGTGQADSELRALSATDLNANNWTFEADKYPTLLTYKLNNESPSAQIQGDIICGQLPAINYVQCLPADSN